MNRRGFISLLAGAAGAPFVPWRGLAEPRVILPAPWYLVEIGAMELRELAVPEDWLVGPWRVNVDSGFIRSDRLADLVAAHAKRMEFFAARTRRPIVAELDYVRRRNFRPIPGYDVLPVDLVPYQRRRG